VVIYHHYEMVFSTLASYPDAVITVKHKGIIIYDSANLHRYHG